MIKMKIKTFKETRIVIEKEVNLWLEKNPNIKIVEFEQSLIGTTNDVFYTIIYASTEITHK